LGFVIYKDAGVAPAGEQNDIMGAIDNRRQRCRRARVVRRFVALEHDPEKHALGL
jgi:hypothetical protein